jgi:hypothetical protein
MVQRWMRKDACMATGASADVFSPAGEFLGSIAAPRGTHGVAFGGKDKKTLFGIVFYGGWGGCLHRAKYAPQRELRDAAHRCFVNNLTELLCTRRCLKS